MYTSDQEDDEVQKLIVFLHARIGEDRERSRMLPTLAAAIRMRGFDEAAAVMEELALRIERDAAAKLEIINAWEDPESVRHLPEGVSEGRDWNEVDEQVAYANAINDAVTALAHAYSDHPDYQEDWVGQCKS